MRLRLTEVAEATGGALHGPDLQCDGVAIDSRALRGGELFVPIVAERDGHDFVQHAVEAGALAWLATTDLDVDGSWVGVDDTAAALLDVGRLARRHLPDRVIGVTGSVGKTTVKDLTAEALGESFATHANERSFNNELGVPVTLAGAPFGTEAVVVEMGARGVGHISLLCGIARPTIGVVTAVALAHAEMFGSIEEVARAKGELVESLPADGTAVLNADDPNVAAMAPRTSARVLRYGRHAGADVTADDVVLDDHLRPEFMLRTPVGHTFVRLQVHGEHQVSNALAASAAALAAGAELEAIAVGLGRAHLSPHRMALQTSPAGARVLNDAYNANPTSMAAALRSLAALRAHRRVAVVGVMAELGDHAAGAHEQVAALAAELGVELVAVDCDLYGVAPVAGIDGALAALGDVGEGDAVLVKGSRVAGLERVAEALLA